MSIVFKDTVRRTPRFDVQLPVEVEGLDLTVRAGTFRMDGKAYVLEEDEIYTITPNETEKVSAFFYLVEMKNDQTVRVFVDEMIGDEAPVPMLDPVDMTVLHRLGSLMLPPGGDSLEDEDVTIQVMRLVPEIQPEVEEK